MSALRPWQWPAQTGTVQVVQARSSGRPSVFCYVCGLSYSAGTRRCPQCRTRLSKPRAFLPLQGLAKVLMVLLTLVIGAIALRLGVQFLGGSMSRWRYHKTIGVVDNVTNYTIFVLSIVFVVWFHRARINAERLGYRQRHSPGWTFWGWLIPLVNLWFPFQIMGDIWRAGLRERQRKHGAPLPALWWTCWLASGVTVGMPGDSANSGPSPHLVADTWPWSLVILGITGALLIEIVRRVSIGPVGSPDADRPIDVLPS